MIVVLSFEFKVFLCEMESENKMKSINLSEHVSLTGTSFSM